MTTPPPPPSEQPEQPDPGPPRPDPAGSGSPEHRAGPPAGGGSSSPYPESETTLLMVELRRLRDRLDRFTRLHTELADAVSTRLGPELEVLRRDTGHQLAVMQTELREVLGALNKERNPPVDWTAMTAAQAQAQWPVLAEWIEQVLVPWYRITRRELPDCWALHPGALVELSWLRSAHIQSYLPASHPHIAAEWHTRWRRLALDNIRAAIPEDLCRPGEHLLSEEHSAARRRATPMPAAAGFEPITTPPARLQPALRQHWQGFYDQAVHEDLARRTDRDAP